MVANKNVTEGATMDGRFAGLSGLDLNPPCSSDALHQLQSYVRFRLPTDYIDVLSQANGGEGTVGESHLVLWKAQDVEPMNTGYQVNEFAPGLVLFGSDGGDEAYAFDSRFEPATIVQVPSITMDLTETRQVGTSFLEFVRYLAHA